MDKIQYKKYTYYRLNNYRVISFIYKNICVQNRYDKKPVYIIYASYHTPVFLYDYIYSTHIVLNKVVV